MKKVIISVLVFICTNVFAQEPVTFRSDYYEIKEKVGEEWVLTDSGTSKPATIINFTVDDITIYFNGTKHIHHISKFVADKDQIDDFGDDYDAFRYYCVDEDGDDLIIMVKFTDKYSIMFVIYNEFYIQLDLI